MIINQVLRWIYDRTAPAAWVRAPPVKPVPPLFVPIFVVYRSLAGEWQGFWRCCRLLSVSQWPVFPAMPAHVMATYPHSRAPADPMVYIECAAALITSGDRMPPSLSIFRFSTDKQHEFNIELAASLSNFSMIKSLVIGFIYRQIDFRHF